MPSNSTREIFGVLYEGRNGNSIPHKCQWSGDVDQSIYHLHQCRGQFPHRKQLFERRSSTHDCMHPNIACIISGMRRTNHVTFVQKNSYLKTKPHQKLWLKHYRNWIRSILDDRDKTKWKLVCCQYRKIAVQRGSATGTTVWPANCWETGAGPSEVQRRNLHRGSHLGTSSQSTLRTGAKIGNMGTQGWSSNLCRLWYTDSTQSSQRDKGHRRWTGAWRKCYCGPWSRNQDPKPSWNLTNPCSKTCILFFERQTPHGPDGECKENNCILDFHSGKEGYKNLLWIFTSWWQKLVRFKICHQESQKLVKIKHHLVWLIWMILIDWFPQNR